MLGTSLGDPLVPMSPFVSIAPRPSWRDLAASWFPAAAPAVPLRPWVAEGDEGFLLARAAWGFAAAARGLASMLGRTPSVWFPDYFCNASLGPLRATGAQVRFYPVTPDAVPDWASCRALAEAGPPDAFVLVHTFGRPGGAADAAAFADETGALLVEDAAHALMPGAGIGGHGGVVVYSPYKMTPLPHGGIVVVRPGPAREAIAAACKALPAQVPPTGSWLARRLAEKGLPGAVLSRMASRRGQTDFDVDSVPDGENDDAAAAAPGTARMLAGMLGDLDRIAAARRKNARFLTDFPWPAGCVPFLDGAGKGGVPYRFVLRCASHEATRNLFRRLRARGIPAESWPDLPPEVMADENAHVAAVLLRRTLVLLPVHQDLDPGTLSRALRGI